MVSKGGRNVLLCTDNQNVLNWAEHAGSHSPVANRILRTAHQFCIRNRVGVLPTYVRSGRNLFADGLTRWAPGEVGRWENMEGMTRIDATTQLWAEMALSDDPSPDDERPPNAFAISGASYIFTVPTTIGFANGAQDTTPRPSC